MGPDISNQSSISESKTSNYDIFSSTELFWSKFVVVFGVIVLGVGLNFSHFHLLLQNHWANFSQTWQKASLGEGNSNFLKWRALLYSKGRLLWNSKKYIDEIKKIFSRTPRSISAKLGTMHPWAKEIQICSNEGPHPFPRGDNYPIGKIHWKNLNIFFYRTTGPISHKLSTKHPWVKGIQVCSNKGSRILQGEIITK